MMKKIINFLPLLENKKFSNPFKTRSFEGKHRKCSR